MEHVFHFMKMHSLQFSSTIPDYLKCTICRNILIDSRFTPCGCKFCLNCITTFLLDGSKPCPSGKEECVDVLSLQTDITKDPLSDTQISNLTVLCPHDNCDHQCRLKAMPDHMTMCSNRPVECEFNVVGCEEKVGGKIGMENHFTTENVDHMRMLLGFLRKMENDIRQRFDSMELRLEEAGEINERKEREWRTEKSQLQTSMREMKAEMDEMKAVEQHTANEMQRINRTNEELEKMIQCQNKTMKELEEKVVESNEMRDRGWQTEKNELLNSMCEMRAEMDKTKVVQQHTTNEMQRISQINDELEKKIQGQKKAIEEMEKKLNGEGQDVAKILMNEITDEVKPGENDQSDDIHQVQEEQCGQVEMMEQRLSEKIQQVQEITHWAEFVWRVELMRDKRREAANGINEKIYSEYFYSHRNGYRLRLRMDPNGFGLGKGTHLSLSFIICKGPFDDVLEWPMNHRIRLAILKQGRGEEHIGYDFSYDMDKDKFAHIFQKPTNENTSFGELQFTSWNELEKNNYLINNDVLFIRCSFACHSINSLQEATQWGEFVWKVESMTNKRQNASNGVDQVYSEYFYSHRNGYRMKLLLYPNGDGYGKGTHLSLFFVICKGKFDDVLQWPMNKKIRLAILKQGTGQEYYTHEYIYEKDMVKFAHSFQKPTNENTGFGHSKFIKWDNLLKTDNLLSNDVLFIKCYFAD